MTPIPEDPSLDLLARYLGGDVAATERLQVEAWLAADPTRATELEDLRQILAAADGPQRKWDLDRVWSGIESRLGRPAAPVERPRAPSFAIAPRSRPWWGAMRAAAAVLAVASGGALWLLRPAGEPAAPSAPTVVATARAQRLSMRLPDSTLVILAPESRLEIAAAYGRAERRVRLEGEAAFEVRHDARRPFAVETDRGVARDLGTRFLIRSYAADSATEVVVVEGLVAVGRTSDADSLVVSPGELARIGADGQLDVTRGVAVDDYLGWTEGRLVFEDTPLREVIARLTRWYDIDVRLADPALGSRRVTASFRAESPDDVLRLISALTGLEIQHSRDGYTLRLKS